MRYIDVCVYFAVQISDIFAGVHLFNCMYNLIPGIIHNFKINLVLNIIHTKKLKYVTINFKKNIYTISI